MKASHLGMCLLLVAPMVPVRANPAAVQLEEPASPGPAEAVHRIQKGETFGLLAKRYGIALPHLLKLNPGCKPESLQVGQVIRLGPRPGPGPTPEPSTSPAEPAQAQPQTGRNTPPAASAQRDPSGSAAPAQAAAPSSATQAGSRAAQTVKLTSSMTFGDFAELHGTEPRRLNQLNGLDLTDAVLLAKGTELYVPVRR